ncbi:MAG: DMT family transporter [Methanocellales archaeon]|nr:DMT family transporter [Methanocellales archaeon]MDD3291904.1 DMT family transporter [Methanocellales archaeon]MDD5235785.1 DMT family transporter [Methanocellales archaeon]MDD5485542.1 DMT family transporter [Methanocellales archaeon]
MILIAVILWSMSFVLTKMGLNQVTPIYLASLRFSIATIIFMGYALIKFEIQQIKEFAKDNFTNLLVLGIVGVTIPNILQNIGMLHLTVSVASILQNSSPAFTFILAALFLRESLGYRKMSGLVLSFTGVLIISMNGNSPTFGNSMAFYGNLMLISTAIAYSIYTVIGKKIVEKNSPLLILAFSTLIGTILLDAISILVEPVSFAYPINIWGIIFALAILCTVCGTLLYFEALRELEASKTNVFTFLIPVFAVIQASVFLGERIHTYQVVCGALIIFGIWLAQTE